MTETLSDKIGKGYDIVGHHPVGYELDKEGDILVVHDVKKAVQDLQNRIMNEQPLSIISINDIINEIFGSKLTGGVE